jgi:Ca2+-dependent lipid-binding protein
MMQTTVSPSKESTVPYPFTVTLIIHSAENLAVADITSSDPYVIILLDNKEIGVRT